MAVLGLRFRARAFSSCGKWGPLFIAVRGPLIIPACLVAEHRLQTRRLSNCGSWAQLLHGMWDPPRPGLEPVSPALAGRFSTTAPPGKPALPILSVTGIFNFCQSGQKSKKEMSCPLIFIFLFLCVYWLNCIFTTIAYLCIGLFAFLVLNFCFSLCHSLGQGPSY